MFVLDFCFCGPGPCFWSPLAPFGCPFDDWRDTGLNLWGIGDTTEGTLGVNLSGIGDTTEGIMGVNLSGIGDMTEGILGVNLSGIGDD